MGVEGMAVTWYHATGWALLLDALAAYRLTRLVTADQITRRARAWAYRWLYKRHDANLDDEMLGGDLDAMVDADMTEDPDGMPQLAYLIRCRWCAGIWCALLVAAGRCIAPDAWGTVGAVLALAAVATLLGGLEQE